MQYNLKLYLFLICKLSLFATKQNTFCMIQDYDLKV